MDVTGNLEAKGFTCSAPEKGQNYYDRLCENEGISVLIYGRELFSVDLIDVSAFDENAVNLLSFIATIPFVENQDLQTEAKTWVENNIKSQEATTIIDNVTFSIYSNGQVVTLEIGELK